MRSFGHRHGMTAVQTQHELLSSKVMNLVRVIKNPQDLGINFAEPKS